MAMAWRELCTNGGVEKCVEEARHEINNADRLKSKLDEVARQKTARRQRVFLELVVVLMPVSVCTWTKAYTAPTQHRRTIPTLGLTPTKRTMIHQV